MASSEHLAVLMDALAEEDINIWNEWLNEKRAQDADFDPDLSEADLNKADVEEGNFVRVNFRGAIFSRGSANVYLTGALLDRADFRGADLREADMHGCSAVGANFSGADLRKADLRWTALGAAEFFKTILDETDLTSAFMSYNMLIDLDLSSVKGLEKSITWQLLNFPLVHSTVQAPTSPKFSCAAVACPKQ